MKTIIIAVAVMAAFMGCKSTTTESQVETTKDTTVVVDTVLVVTDTTE